MKGVSPVVATVLLIAIAVIAAVGVWFFVQNMTSKQSSAPTMAAFQVESCTLSATSAQPISLINLGDAAFAAKAFNVYTTAGVQVGTASITIPAGAGSRPATGQTITNTSAFTAGSYYMTADGVPKISFNCA